MRSLILLLLVGCTSYSPNLPSAPFLCGSGTPPCPDGYTCMMGSAATGGVCVQPNGELPDAGPKCNDDSALEPNNTINQAYVTPVDGMNKTTIPLKQLAICPAGDKDIYVVNLVVMTSLEAIMTYDDGGAPLQVVIESGTGTTLANGVQVADPPNTFRAYINSLAASTSYFIAVYGPASGAVQTNNYSLTINTGT